MVSSSHDRHLELQRSGVNPIGFVAKKSLFHATYTLHRPELVHKSYCKQYYTKV